MPEPARLDAQATDTIGRVWLLLIRKNGAASIWRIGEKVAEIPWAAVTRAYAAANERHAEAVLSAIAHQAEGLVPAEILREFARPAGPWLDEHANPDADRLVG